VKNIVKLLFTSLDHFKEIISSTKTRCVWMRISSVTGSDLSAI
jgi:hypothetical protein